MSKKIAFIFPGQGAQYVGMGKDFYDQYAAARNVFDEADDLLNTKFSNLIFEGPSAELTLTKNSQLAIYINSIAILNTLQQQFPELKPSVCGGLSLGEYTALTAAGKISFQDCLPLVKARAQYMNEACEVNPGSMQVVLGMDPSAVEQALQGIDSVWIANLNCPGQVVIAGTHHALEKAALRLKECGAKRVLPLDVSGAFHSDLMKYARQKLEPKIQAALFKTSAIDLVMNVPGGYVTSLDEIREFLIQQVTSPVRWEMGIRAMQQQGIDLFLEVGCGKTLSGMNKKIGVTQTTFSIDKIADLDEFSKLQEGFYATHVER